jgi:hypothetical protein
MVQQVASQCPVLMQKPVWKFLGNWFVEAHIHGNAQAKNQLVEVCFLCDPSVDT